MTILHMISTCKPRFLTRQLPRRPCVQSMALPKVQYAYGLYWALADLGQGDGTIRPKPRGDEL